ncbi:hypothetical protein BABINDRAFT_163087 [Babjeviella inositovora NRRL Y-12698]|uniref:Fe2OG dioxygenase domain-containing protein n=1 Tax=Babjeviella inositovora NRRL Y-12698 TaxID=984486 RepID=A0A1E3QM43_9ASCO|nr:uncharacterized protein BABINDRAFT_163087 [Babjeviella inositovora NRRL Y-12698]ODQ78057.1 hypothetical protein BABINDRAFT_163087 [Babjeviella inositovora NRRL Y-12698]
MSGLTDAQLSQFHEEGCLAIPGFLSPEQLSRIMGYSHKLMAEFDPATHPMTKFTTNDDNHVGDRYFLESSDKIRYFLDTDALDAAGALTKPAAQSVNKVGHGLHLAVDPHNPCPGITFDPRVQAIARQLEFTDPRILQSMLIFKHPSASKHSANAVPSHTDGAFLYTDPLSCIGFWFALEDCTLTNGCLHYNPGTHKTHEITKRFVRVKDEKGATRGTNFAVIPGMETHVNPEDVQKDYKLVECPAGTLVLIHNRVLHKSEDNVSDKSRFAYTFHIVEGPESGKGVVYDLLNWLQIPTNVDGEITGDAINVGAGNFSRLYT